MYSRGDCSYRIATYDRANYDHFGLNACNLKSRDTRLPSEYCVVNLKGYVINCADFSELLQKAPENLRKDNSAAVLDFIHHMDPTKRLWRKAKLYRTQVFLNTDSKGVIKNSGYQSLAVGEPVYCTPAIVSLSATHPTENFFHYKDETYVYPMTLGGTEIDRIRTDLFNQMLAPRTTQPSTIFVQRIIEAQKDYQINLLPIWNYFNDLSSIGYIVETVDQSSLKWFNDQQLAVPVTGICTVLFNNMVV